MSIKRKVELEKIKYLIEEEIENLRKTISNIKKLDEDLGKHLSQPWRHCGSGYERIILCGMNDVLHSDFSQKVQAFFEEKGGLANGYIVEEKLFDRDCISQFRKLLRDEALPDLEKRLEELELNLKELTEELNEVLTSSEIIYFGSQIISLLKQLLENK